jgi:hypothetical protein
MRRLKLWVGLALVLGIVVGGVWAYWNFELRWRPKTISKNQAEIAAILQSSGWVSPNLPGKKLYMISSRTCEACARFAEKQFPDLHEKGVDTRVIAVAPNDENGAAQSTPADRATVAQLWITRDWKLLQRWQAAPADAWKAPGIPPADSDAARMAVVEAGRATVDKLTPLMKANGVRFGYPLLVWWNEAGEMRACACDKPQTYRFVRKELGV